MAKSNQGRVYSASRMRKTDNIVKTLIGALLLVTAHASTPALAQTPKPDLDAIMDQAEDALRRKDFPEALRLNLKAAELGDPQAQTNVGAIFQDGAGVDRNPDEAMKWYLRAANGGNVQAEKNLGDLYIDKSLPAECRDP